MKRFVLPAILGLLATPAMAADYALDFSTSANPAGAWSYGSRPTLGGAFSLSGTLNTDGTAAAVKYWSPQSGVDTDWPRVGLNTGNSAVQIFGTVDLAAGQGLLHPGPTGHYADARLTTAAPMTGVLNTSFIGIDYTGGTTTDVHVYKNGIALFDSSINAFGELKNYTSTLTFAVGDTLDFLVGWGANENYLFDSTGFYTTISEITAAPEPASLALLVGGLMTLGFLRRRRR